MKVVLWLVAACVVILVALAVSRGVRFTSEPEAKAPVETAAPAAQEAAAPAVAAAPEPLQTAPPPEPPAPGEQVAEDAAAVGMTTREDPPAAEPSEPTDSQP